MQIIGRVAGSIPRYSEELPARLHIPTAKSSSISYQAILASETPFKHPGLPDRIYRLRRPYYAGPIEVAFGELLEVGTLS